MLRTMFIRRIAVESSTPRAAVAVLPMPDAEIPPAKLLKPVKDSISLFIKATMSKTDPGMLL